MKSSEEAYEQQIIKFASNQNDITDLRREISDLKKDINEMRSENQRTTGKKPIYFF